jgi:hypothetical protein
MGRQMMQRERQRLAKEQADLGEKMAKEAIANREMGRPIEKAPKIQVGVNRSIVRRCAAVLASEGVAVPIKAVAAQGNEGMRAWTDFERIAIRFVPHEDVRLLAATLRGLMYHEGGHIRWTVPFRELAALAGVTLPAGGAMSTSTKALHTAWNCLEDQRMETAVVSDSPRKAAYFTPLVMTEHAATLDNMAANWPLLVWRRYLPSKLRVEARRMFVVKHNMLSGDGDELATMLDDVVTRYVMATDAADMWACVEAMLIILRRCQPLASNMEDAGHTQQGGRELPEDFQGLTIPVSPSMMDDDAAPEMDEDDDVDIDDDESLADLDEDEIQHVMEVLSHSMLSPEVLLEVRYVMEGSEGSKADEGSKDEDEDFAGSPGGLLDDDDEDDEDDDSDGTEGSDDQAEEDDADEAPSERDVRQGNSPADDSQPDDGGDEDDADDADEDDEADEGDDEDHGGSDSGTHAKDEEPEDEFTQEDLDELLQDAEEERYNQRDLDGDMEAFHDANDNSVTDLDTYSAGFETNDVLISQAESLAQDIEDAFHAHTMDRQPAWVEQQRRGVLNVGRYATRAPGDTEFFRQWTEDDQPGYDIAVSVLLDYSGSMSAHTAQLAQAGYACKLACQKLEIPCTVVLWDTEALTLWDANEVADGLPTIQAAGGTVPDMALVDLDNQRCDREKHLVLIMTDGQWQGRWANGGGTLAWYKDDGRIMLGFGFARDARAAQNHARSMVGRGCDEAFGIVDLMAIPEFLESALLELV